MSSKTIPLSVAALSLVLTGCSVTDALTESSKIDYRSAKKGPGLDVPPDLVSPRSDDRYRVPEPTGDRTLSGFQRGQGTTATQGGPNLLPTVDGVRMERSGTQRWLVVNRPPEVVWPILKSFWTESGFAPAVDSSEVGIYEPNGLKIERRYLRTVCAKPWEKFSMVSTIAANEISFVPVLSDQRKAQKFTSLTAGWRRCIQINSKRTVLSGSQDRAIPSSRLNFCVA
jgi:NlpB/DapX lipoprotein